MFRPGTRSPFQAEDFAIGRVVDLYAHRFLLTEASPFALRYMEERPEAFPESDPRAVCDVLLAAAGDAGITNVDALFSGRPSASGGSVTAADFEAGLVSLSDSAFTAQQVTTLLRACATGSGDRVSFTKLSGMLKGALNDGADEAATSAAWDGGAVDV